MSTTERLSYTFVLLVLLVALYAVHQRNTELRAALPVAGSQG